MQGGKEALPIFINRVVAPKIVCVLKTLLPITNTSQGRDVMAEKRMLIVPSELVKKVDDNRGDMSQAEFIEFLIDSQFKQKEKEHDNKQYATKEEVQSLEQDIKKVLRTFLDFFISYGLELGKQSPKTEFDELNSRLKELENDLDSEAKGKEAKIKWK
jgi:hypothetical protein